MIEDIFISLSWDCTVWTFFRRIWSLRDTTFGCFGVIPHFRSCFACVASGCFWVAFFFFSYLCLLLWPFCVHMFFSRKLFSWIDSHAPASGWTWDVQSITTVHSFYLFMCTWHVAFLCAHVFFQGNYCPGLTLDQSMTNKMLKNQGVHFWKRKGHRFCKSEHLKF